VSTLTRSPPATLCNAFAVRSVLPHDQE